MKQRWLYAAVSVVALSFPAQAEPMRVAQAVEFGWLPPHEIITIVRSAGLDPVGPPFRQGQNYILRAISRDDQEVRVVVSARQGEILRIAPVMQASRMPPPDAYRGRYQRLDADEAGPPPAGYSAPEGRRYSVQPLPDDDDDMPYEDAPRPPAAISGAPRYSAASPSGLAEPPPVIRAAPSARGSDIARGTDLPPPGVTWRRSEVAVPQGGPRVISADPPPSRGTSVPLPGPAAAIQPRPDGLLPPPPERFPQRAPAPLAPTPQPPVKRAAATAPKVAPLPKPKPSINSAAAAAAAPTEARPPAPAPAAAKPKPAAEAKPAADGSATASTGSAEFPH